MGFNPDNTSSPIRFTPSKDNSYRSSETDRPSSASRSGKDFKKVLEKTDDDEQGSNQSAQSVSEEGEAAGEATLESGKRKIAQSLFDLSGQKGIPSNVEGKSKEGTLTAESPNTLFSKVSSREGKKGIEKGDDADTEVAALIDSPEKGKFTTRFATEQSDLTYVNPMAVSNTDQITLTTAAKAEKPVLHTTNIQALINQMIDKVNEIKQDGRTETVVTLSHPPQFAGANIVVTAFDSAKNEFNISFENLTQAAKNILDIQVNRDSLLHALEVKGYNVHILTATTISENRPVVEEPQAGEQFGRGNQQQQQGQEREKEEGNA